MDPASAQMDDVPFRAVSTHGGARLGRGGGRSLGLPQTGT